MPHRIAPDDSRLSSTRIEAAARAIDPVFLHSPQYLCGALSDAIGVQTLIKVETLNPIRSFKGRGTSWFAASLEPGERLVTASAGNFGQGLAYACRLRGIELTVYASVNANPLKVARMRALGATVIQHGEDFDAAKLEARHAAVRDGLRMVEDGREPRLSEGAGTIAVELLAGPERFETILVPLGNGALLGGIAHYLKARDPSIRVIGVAARGAPCMEQSWRAGLLIETPTMATIADGIGTRVPIAEALADLRGTIDDIVLVDDARMIEAMRLAHIHAGLVLEPSGAAGLAALLDAAPQLKGHVVATVLCGGNLTPQQMRDWLAV